MANKTGLPAISSTLPPDVRQFLERVRDFVGSVNNTSAVDQLLAAGLAEKDRYGNLSLTAIGAAEAVDITPPPAIVGLVATGGLATILLEWTDPAYANLSYVELYRATADNLAVAAHLGQTQGIMYADAVNPGTTYFYWARIMSKAGVLGPWNALGGTQGSTSADPSAIIDLLTESGTYGDTPFYYQATPTTLNGVAVPVGTYVRAAFIADGTISNAKIGNLMVDNAKIANMSVAKLTAGSLAVGQYIQSTNYVANTAGFRINADGSVEFNNIYARGNVRATSFSAITLQVGEHIKQGLTSYGDTVNSGVFFGDNGAGTPVFKIQGAYGGMNWNGTNLTFQSRSAVSGERFEINENCIKVYDATGLRVQIGNLAV